MKLFTEYESGCWIKGISNNRWFMAKVFDEDSPYGINNGRVSKLSISKTNEPNKPYINFFDQMDYNYDRGVDFDNLPEGLLDAILSDLESL